MNTNLLSPSLIALLFGSLAGCGPTNLHDCKMEAAKMPTERGSSIAAISCDKKFGEPDWNKGVLTYPPGQTPKPNPFDKFDPATAQPAQPARP